MASKTQYKKVQEEALKMHYAELRRQLPDFAVTWLNSKPNLTWSSRVAYADDIIRYLKYVIDSVDGLSANETVKLTLIDISDEEAPRRFDDDFFNAYASYLSECADGQYRGNNRNSIERKLAPIRGIYLYYCNRGDIKLNPMANYPRYKEPEEKYIESLSNAEVQKIFRAAEYGDGIKLTERQKAFRDKTRQRDYAIISLFLGTGIRVSELVGADLKHVDFEGNNLLVTRKGEHADKVYFGEQVAEALAAYVNGERAGIKAKTDEEPLFYSLHGKRISVDAVENLLKKYTGDLTNKHVSAHLLRRTYGTALYHASGGDLALVQDALGHASPATTKKFYLNTHDTNMIRAQQISEHQFESKISKKKVKKIFL